MKKCLLISLVSCLMLAIASCTTETYETGDGEYSRLRADFSMININSDGQVTSFLTDDDKEVQLTEPTDIKGATPDTIYRALVYYRETQETTDLLGLNTVLVTRPILNTVGTELKKDPVDFESAWFSSNGTYLNLSLNIKIGVAEGEDDINSQRLGVLLDKADKTSSQRKLYYSLLHDQSDVPEYYSYKTYLSIPAEDNFQPGDSVVININTYDGILRKAFLVPEKGSQTNME